MATIPFNPFLPLADADSREAREIDARMAARKRPTGKGRVPVICLECSKKFTTASLSPSCPKCGGSDIEVR